MYRRVRKCLAQICSRNFDSPTSPPKGSDRDSSPKSTGVLKVLFPRKSQRAREENLFSLRKSPASLVAAWQSAPACLCPGFVLPELVAHGGEVVAKEWGNLPAEVLQDLWQEGRERVPIPLLCPRAPVAPGGASAGSCTHLGWALQAASIPASAGLSPGAAEESLNVTVQHPAN